MHILLAALVIGIASGLRAFTGIAAVCWAARLHWLSLESTKLAFLGFRWIPYLFTLLGLGEFVTDQLPSTPSRTVPKQFIPRVLLGGFCGAAIGISGGMLLAGIATGVVGSVIGTLGGAKARSALAGAFGKDAPAAAIEDLLAIFLAFFAVWRLAI